MADKYDLKIAREATRRAEMAELASLAKSPLVQAFAVWVGVEYLQRYHKFGEVTGTILEGSTVVKLLAPEMKQATENMAKITEALAPLLLKAAAVAAVA